MGVRRNVNVWSDSRNMLWEEDGEDEWSESRWCSDGDISGFVTVAWEILSVCCSPLCED